MSTISQWLGHASLNTTMAYARADLDLKHQALMQVFPDAPRPPRAGRVINKIPASAIPTRARAVALQASAAAMSRFTATQGL
jgi:hypothetical protein